MKNLQCLCLLVILLACTAFTQDILGQNESYEDENPTTNEQAAPTELITPPAAPLVRDGAYDKHIKEEREILEYDHLREADIFWQKRVWRVIDTRQKMNLTFSNPEEPFISVLLQILQNNPNEDLAFMDDNFTTPVSIPEIAAGLGSVDTIEVIDPETYEMTTEIVQNEFNYEQVKKFRLKEDWIFDEETSTMVVRVLGIAPIMDVIDDNGNYRGQQAMFWAYYPNLRQHLVKYEVFNPLNDVMRLTWFDLFEMRYFASYIMKESNIQDRRITDYSDGRDALLEAERIKQELFEFEHNLWSY